MESSWVHPYIAEMDVVDPVPNPWFRPSLPYHYNMDKPFYGTDSNYANLYNVAQKGEKDIFNGEVRPDVYASVNKIVSPTPLWRGNKAPEIRKWEDGPKPKEKDEEKKPKTESSDDLDDKDILAKK